MPFSDSRLDWKDWDEDFSCVARERRDSVRDSCSARECERADSVAWVLEVDGPVVLGWEMPVVVADGAEAQELRIRLRRVVGGSGAVADGAGVVVVGAMDGCVDVDGVSSAVWAPSTTLSTFVPVSRGAGSDVSCALLGRGEESPDALSSGVYMKISLSDGASSSPIMYSVALRIAIPSRHCLSAVICCRFCTRSACSAFLRD